MSGEPDGAAFESASEDKSGWRTVGLIGWAVLVAAVLIWEGIGLIAPHDRWPTLSDMFRTITSSVAGRWVLFALWLWLGWHLFVRGWRFFLRG